MATSLGGWFDKVFFDAHGEPCASGELRFYQTGTDIPQGVATFDGTPLGAVIRLDDDGRPESDFRFYTDKIYRVVVADADGVVVKTIDGVAIPEGEGGAMYNPMIAEGDLIVGGTDGEPERLAPGNEGDALKIVSGVPTWTTDQTGMANPMTTKGDLIVGGTGGEPDRLGVGADGDILAAALFAGNLSPTWEAGTKKYRNVYGDLPSPQIDDGYLGCLFYLSSAGQTLNLPSSASIPAKSFIDFVCVDDAATLTITPQGTTILNAQGSAVTIGGKSASFYRLTFLGHGGSGDEWAVGGTDTATQPGDHKTAVDGADASPDYLSAKLSAGTGISLTNTGSAVEIAADAQSGDHQLLVSATDAAAGYLGAKLTAGANVTLTTQTDLDGVQTLEIAAAGGGGGGSSRSFCEPFGQLLDGYLSLAMTSTTSKIAWFGRTPLRNTKIKSVLVGTFGADANPYSELGVYAMRSNRALTLIDKVSSYTLTPDGSLFFEFTTPVTVGNEIIFIGSLCAPTLLWRNTAYTIMQTTANAPLVSQMQKNSTVFLDTSKYPVAAYPFTSVPNESLANTCSRRGFYWPNFTLSTLPATTTSSDWHTTGSFLILPYVAIETIS